MRLKRVTWLISLKRLAASRARDSSELALRVRRTDVAAKVLLGTVKGMKDDRASSGVRDQRASVDDDRDPPKSATPVVQMHPLPLSYQPRMVSPRGWEARNT